MQSTFEQVAQVSYGEYCAKLKQVSNLRENKKHEIQGLSKAIHSKGLQKAAPHMLQMIGLDSQFEVQLSYKNLWIKQQARQSFYVFLCVANPKCTPETL